MKTAVLSTFAVLALLIGLLAGLIFYPFAPFQISNFATSPNQVCPQANVAASANVSVESGWDLEKLTIESTWEPVKGNKGLAVGGGTVTIPNPTPALGKPNDSPVLRIAPAIPGEYKTHSEATMIGTFSKDSPAHGWPKIQIIEYDAENTLTVLSPTAPECKGAK